MTDKKHSLRAAPRQDERKRMTVFYAKDAKAPGPDMMPREGIDEGVLAGLAKVMEVNGKEGVGEMTRILFSEPGDEGFSLLWAWFKSGYVLPRHSHNADCLYYVVAGELHMGSHVLRKGDGFFVPEDHAYGYVAGPEGVEILEFRNATRYNFVFKANDEALWDRVASAFRDHSATWETETTPPSQR